MTRCLPSGIALGALFAVSLVTPAGAHGDHGGGGGTILLPGTTLVTMSYEVSYYRTISDERLLELSAAGINAHGMKEIAVPSLSVARGITRDLTLGMRVPFLANREIRETGEDPDNPEVVQRGGVYGFGDISFTGTYRVLHDDHAGIEASLILGFKAPTGRTGAVDKFGELFETEHQPGSGSWDGIFGAAASQKLGKATLSANVLYTLAGSGSQDTTLGDRLAYGATVSYRLWQSYGAWGAGSAMHLGGPSTRPEGMMNHGGPKGEHNHGGATSPQAGHVHDPAVPSGSGTALDVSLGINGLWWDKQTVAGVKDDNTGGNVVYITPGVRLTVDNWAGFVNVGVPIARELNGIQSEPRLQLSTGVSVQF